MDPYQPCGSSFFHSEPAIREIRYLLIAYVSLLAICHTYSGRKRGILSRLDGNRRAIIEVAGTRMGLLFKLPRRVWILPTCIKHSFDNHLIP
ncbi:MAG: hypothetical protein AB2615_12665, partial [Candidatus Thiodiazotropha sp.]